VTYAFDLLVPWPRDMGFTLRDNRTGVVQSGPECLLYGPPDSRAVFSDIEDKQLDLGAKPGYARPATLYVHYGLLFADPAVRQFLENESGATFDVKRVHAAHALHGRLPDERWAMRVRTRIDCVNLEWSGASFGGEKLNLAHVAQRSDVRRWQLRHLVVDETLIPNGVRLLELGNWWGALLIERTFAETLIRRFGEGMFDHGLCTLKLPDIVGSWGRVMFETR
jgi:hypothetical protein